MSLSETLVLPPALPCLSTFGGFLYRPLAVPSLAVGHNGLHPKNWLSGITTVQRTVQTAETSEVVVSFADAFTSVCVLAKPALLGDATATEGPTVYLLSGFSVVCSRHFTMVFHGGETTVCLPGFAITTGPPSTWFMQHVTRDGRNMGSRLLSSGTSKLVSALKIFPLVPSVKSSCRSSAGLKCTWLIQLRQRSTIEFRG